jgi:hypothetical protein
MYSQCSKISFYTHDNLLSASEVTLCSILRRYYSVEGFGFNSHLQGTAEVCNGDKLDESQVTYRVLLEQVTQVNGAYNDGCTYELSVV